MPYKDIEKRKEYHKRYHKVWYEKNKIARRAQVMKRKRKIRVWFRALKEEMKCSKCPESNSVCLDFHHLNPRKKDGWIANMVRDGRCKVVILNEMSKCIVVCSNCHRKIHAIIRGSSNR